MIKPTTPPPTIGVEEEYQLVDSETGRLRPDCEAVMEVLERDTTGGAEIQHELHLTQIEMASPVCRDLDEVRRVVADVRGRLITAARRVGAELVAAGTHPMRPPSRDSVTPKERYRSMAHRYQQVARELCIFGCHVHVHMPDRELGVQVMNRVVPWLPALQALTANSPFWNDQDTGYASYRRELWQQMPMAGPPLWFDNAEDLRRCVDQLVRAQAITDATRIYWDVRLPEKTPTIEFRVMDVMTRIDETVAVVGLIRAIVQRCERDAVAGIAAPRPRPELMKVAMWEAARFGTSDHLIDPIACRRVSAAEHIEGLVEWVRDPLEAAGDYSRVHSVVQRIVELGNGATRQRNYRRNATWEDVVKRLVEQTALGTVHARG